MNMNRSRVIRRNPDIRHIVQWMRTLLINKLINYVTHLIDLRFVSVFVVDCLHLYEDVANTQVIDSPTRTPYSSTIAGEKGKFAIRTNYLY